MLKVTATKIKNYLGLNDRFLFNCPFRIWRKLQRKYLFFGAFKYLIWIKFSKYELWLLLPIMTDLGLKFTCEVKANMLKVLLSHTEYVSRVCKEDISPFNILSHVLIFAFLEVFQLFLVISFNPTSLVEVYRFPSTLCIVFMFQSVLNNFKLELSNCSYNTSIIELINKLLCDTFIHKLFYTFLELLRLHRIVVFNIFEKFWWETW